MEGNTLNKETLDQYLETKIAEIMARNANDPAKAQVQAAHTKAFVEAVADADKKGVKMPAAGDSFGRFAMGILKSYNDPGKALSWAEKTYPDDKALSGYFKALTVSTPSEGGFVVPDVLSAEMIQYLYPQLAFAKLGARRINMPRGNLTLPRFDAAASASYIGETEKAVDTKPTIGTVKGSSRKLAALIPISNDLIRDSDPTFETYVRDDVIMALRLKKDYTAFYGAGTLHTPSGLNTLLPAAQKYGSSGTAFTANVPGTIKGGLLSANVPMSKPGWAFSGWVWTWLYNLMTSTGAYIYRDEMNRGLLLGDPYVVCNQISTSNSGAPSTSDYGDIFYGDWSEFIDFVQVDMELMASKEASYVNSDGNTISAMQNDMTVLRALCLHDFGVRHIASFIKGTYKYSTT